MIDSILIGICIFMFVLSFPVYLFDFWMGQICTVLSALCFVTILIRSSERKHEPK